MLCLGAFAQRRWVSSQTMGLRRSRRRMPETIARAAPPLTKRTIEHEDMRFVMTLGARAKRGRL